MAFLTVILNFKVTKNVVSKTLKNSLTLFERRSGISLELSQAYFLLHASWERCESCDGLGRGVQVAQQSVTGEWDDTATRQMF
jgi:hypothetical protein